MKPAIFEEPCKKSEKSNAFANYSAIQTRASKNNTTVRPLKIVRNDSETLVKNNKVSNFLDIDFECREEEQRHHRLAGLLERSSTKKKKPYQLDEQSIQLGENVQIAQSRFSEAMNAVELSKISSRDAFKLQPRDRNYSEFSLDYNQSQITQTIGGGEQYNRKEKSLGELCRRFLSIYGKSNKDFLLLDQCTKELQVERRRIYDIINILESFCVIRRQAKNSYQWRGIDKIVHSIEAQIKQSEQFQKQSRGKRSEKENCDWNVMPNFVEIQSDEEDAHIFQQLSMATGGKIKQYKKEKSLGILCQQFIHLFVTWNHVLSLEEAAKRISMCENFEKVEEQNQKLKTKIRRLYDIANVLSSIGLIEKCHAVNSKKPAFKWIGLEGTIRAVEELKEINQEYLSKLGNQMTDTSNPQNNKITVHMKQSEIENNYKQSEMLASPQKHNSEEGASDSSIPQRTIDPEDEDQLIKHLEAYQRQRLEQDPIRELNEALMDRTTARQNRIQIQSSQSLEEETPSEEKSSGSSHKKRLQKSYEKQKMANMVSTSSDAWIELKTKRDLDLMNQFIKPMPRQVSKYRTHEFLNQTIKLVNLTNMINYMAFIKNNASQY